MTIAYLRPCIATLCGFAAGVLALAIWMFTFDPSTGIELSRYLFPASAAILSRMHPNTSIPVPLWYCGALLQWIILGTLVDIIRGAFRRRSSR